MVTDKQVFGLKQAFAFWLKAWRLRNGLTQAEAGKLLCCSRSTICRAEMSCKLNWDLAIKILSKDPEELRKEVMPWLDRR